jgi:hypothetical protein
MMGTGSATRPTDSELVPLGDEEPALKIVSASALKLWEVVTGLNRLRRHAAWKAEHATAPEASVVQALR